MPENSEAVQSIIDEFPKTNELYDALADQMDKVREMGISTEELKELDITPELVIGDEVDENYPRFAAINEIFTQQNTFDTLSYHADGQPLTLEEAIQRSVEREAAAVENIPQKLRASISQAMRDLDNMPAAVAKFLGETEPYSERMQTILGSHEKVLASINDSSYYDLAEGTLSTNAKYLDELDVATKERFYVEGLGSLEEVNPRPLAFFAEACTETARRIDEILLREEESTASKNAEEKRLLQAYAASLELRGRMYKEVSNRAINFRFRHNIERLQHVRVQEETAERFNAISERYRSAEFIQGQLFVENRSRLALRREIHDEADVIARGLYEADFSNESEEPHVLNERVYKGGAQLAEEALKDAARTALEFEAKPNPDGSTPEIWHGAVNNRVTLILNGHPEYKQWLQEGRAQSSAEMLARISSYNNLNNEQKIWFLLHRMQDIENIRHLDSAIPEEVNEESKIGMESVLAASAFVNSVKNEKSSISKFLPESQSSPDMRVIEALRKTAATRIEIDSLRGIRTEQETNPEFIKKPVQNVEIMQAQANLIDNGKEVVANLEQMIGGYEAVVYKSGKTEAVPYMSSIELRDGIHVLDLTNPAENLLVHVTEGNERHEFAVRIEGATTFPGSNDTIGIPEGIFYPHTSIDVDPNAYRAPPVVDAVAIKSLEGNQYKGSLEGDDLASPLDHIFKRSVDEKEEAVL
ncbi:MAG: hypothetical protein ACOZAO_00805 [Patescibacteria group bacterium]